MTALRRPLAVLALLASLALVPAPVLGQSPDPTTESTPPEEVLAIPEANPLLPPLATDDVSRVADSSDAVEVGVALSEAAFADATPWLEGDSRYQGATGVVLARAAPLRRDPHRTIEPGLLARSVGVARFMRIPGEAGDRGGCKLGRD